MARAAARFAKAEPLPLGERVQCETGLHEVPLSAQDPPTELQVSELTMERASPFRKCALTGYYIHLFSFILSLLMIYFNKYIRALL